MEDKILEKIVDIDDEFKLIRKNSDDIIEELDFENDDDKLICSSIINSMEKCIANNLKDNKCVNIPYIGCVRKNQVVQTIRENKKNFKLARPHLSKEEYKENVRAYVIDVQEKQKAADREKMKIKRLKSKFKKKYNQLYIGNGISHAELFIRSILWLKPVEFNQEIQDFYDSLNKD